MFSVCVYCGAAEVAAPYHELATAVGKGLAERGMRLIYGGGNTGLMGAVAEGALSAGGEVIGIMPTFLVEQERAHRGLLRLEVVPDMATRKERFFRLSDVFLTLPGGMGTLDELFESITAYQLRLHTGKSLILNHKGFYEGLRQQMDFQHAEGFVHRAEDLPWAYVNDTDALWEALQHLRAQEEPQA